MSNATIDLIVQKGRSYILTVVNDDIYLQVLACPSTKREKRLFHGLIGSIAQLWFHYFQLSLLLQVLLELSNRVGLDAFLNYLMISRYFCSRFSDRLSFLDIFERRKKKEVMDVSAVAFLTEANVICFTFSNKEKVATWRICGSTMTNSSTSIRRWREWK